MLFQCRVVKIRQISVVKIELKVFPPLEPTGRVNIFHLVVVCVYVSVCVCACAKLGCKVESLELIIDIYI